MIEFFDLYGNKNTVGNKTSIDAINSFVHAYVNYADPDLSIVRAALESDPSCPMLQVIQSFVYLSGNRPDLASPLVSSISNFNEREGIWKTILQKMIDKSSVVEDLVNLMGSFPDDMMGLKVGVLHCLNVGQSESILLRIVSFLQSQLSLHLDCRHVRTLHKSLIGQN